MLSSIDRERASPSDLRSSLANPTPWSMRVSGRSVTPCELMHPYPPRDDRAEPEDRPHRVGPARADQSGNTQDLTTPECEAHGSCRCSDAQPVDLEDWLAGRMRHVRKELVEVAPDHGRDDRPQIGFRQSPVGDGLTVSQHGIGLGDPARLLRGNG